LALAKSIRLKVPVIVLVLCATAIPIELRPLGTVAVDFRIFPWDFLANVAGYVPVGLVLGGTKPRRALLLAVLMSTCAEIGQLGMMHRDPSVGDIIANTIGAIVGIAIASGCAIRSMEFTPGGWKAFVVAALACALIFVAPAIATRHPPNERGTTSAGTLEAHWTFDEGSGPVALDSSGHGLNGRFHREPVRIEGVLGRAVRFQSTTDYMAVGQSTELRLVGSMTVSAWINTSSFPSDDAAIVSSYDGLGYQLDTTPDEGPRTIGFKLADECGSFVARYGATPLVVDRWYHLAGVYDAEAQTLHTYLNGKLDDGSLIGRVTTRHRSSRGNVYIGRRNNLKGFEFAGAIDDVRIYSRALTEEEIGQVMRGAGANILEAPRSSQRDRVDPGQQARWTSLCGGQSDREDAQLPGIAAILGVLASMALAGIWPRGGWFPSLVVSLAAGLLLLGETASPLGAFGGWMIALASLAGGASVIAGRRSS
jgi:Concanavalin A-like lectin/glucanases superfamily/VanZ like family